LLDSRKLLERFPGLADRFRHLEAGWLRWRERLAVVWEAVHQFRVLTARYLELIWQDRRGLRLLLLQAPVVALFLLLGFVGKDYPRLIPYPRPLSSEEREMLTMLRSLNQTLEQDKPLEEQQKKALARVQMKVPGLPAADGQSVLEILRHLAREDLDEQQKT